MLCIFKIKRTYNKKISKKSTEHTIKIKITVKVPFRVLCITHSKSYSFIHVVING